MNEKLSTGGIDPSPNLTIRPPPFERRPQRQVQNAMSIRQQRLKN